jgi:hypothetical protein
MTRLRICSFGLDPKRDGLRRQTRLGHRTPTFGSRASDCEAREEAFHFQVLANYLVQIHFRHGSHYSTTPAARKDQPADQHRVPAPAGQKMGLHPG